MARLTSDEAYELGFGHGYITGTESGSDEVPIEGWDSLLINADPAFAREKFGWKGQESDEQAVELLAEYCRGCQDGAVAACE